LLAFFSQVHTAHKAVNLTGSVHDPLLTREERVTITAKLDLDRTLAGGAGGPLRIASATHNGSRRIFRMNALFHFLKNLFIL
jgi:hypothetical protein